MSQPATDRRAARVIPPEVLRRSRRRPVPVGRSGRALATALADAFLADTAAPAATGDLRSADASSAGPSGAGPSGAGPSGAGPSGAGPNEADREEAAAVGWTRVALVARGSAVIGARRRWLFPVASAVLQAYREPPADRPRELAAFIAAQPRLGEAISALRQKHHRVRILRRPVSATRMIRSRFPVPPIDDLAALADWLGLTDEELDWYADRRELNRQAPAERLRHYRYRWLAGRLIEAPKPRLKALHRRLLADLVGLIPAHPAAHGFVPGRGVHTFAAPHAGRRTVLRLDVVSFFAAITAGRVYGLLRACGYPEPVAHTLAAFTTTRTPASVLRVAPADLPDRGYRLALLRAPHLPQGAPTSPALANICGYRLDRRLTGLAAAFDASYTRYADDLAFSGDFGTRRATELARQAEAITADEGLRVHPGKTRIRGTGDRQLLAGLVVNARPAAPRDGYDRLRAVLHSTARDGLAAANRDNHPDFAGYLTGRVAWFATAHPSRAAKLRQLLAAALHRS